ncbi:low temperature requirement protein A [Naasia sp. SYSU D00948]|uniref:low temperature requirement protein A n=1 Tax=Naasia sp. SYSU D00948 TaxID=2817379 RepID=UPI001B312DFF|nr:low temperature requirement protein A [Naasia sp. SYSU D00948]
MSEPGRERRAALRFRTSDESHRVTTFELFFDLVFVFAFTQVTHYMSDSHSALGVLQAMIILGILWWSWVSYSWLANQTFVDEGMVRVGMSVAMAAMFLVALVIPEAFEDFPGGLHAPLVFAVSYLVVRLAHLLLYLGAAADDRPLRDQVLRTFVAMFLGTGFVLAGAIVGGPAQTWLWLLGLTLDVAYTYLTGHGGNWRVHSAAHWAERFGLIVILALGESIVAIGVGVAQEPITTEIVIGSLLAIALSVALWWLYFDVVAIAAEHELARRKGADRANLAIDGYTYLHFLIIAGVVLSALGVEQAMHHVNDSDPLGLFAGVALFGGTSLYLAGHAAFWWRAGGRLKTWRLGAAALLIAVIPLGAAVPALASLAIAVAITGAVAAIETLAYAQGRAEIRASAHPRRDQAVNQEGTTGG